MLLAIVLPGEIFYTEMEIKTKILTSNPVGHNAGGVCVPPALSVVNMLESIFTVPEEKGAPMLEKCRPAVRGMGGGGEEVELDVGRIGLRQGRAGTGAGAGCRIHW